MRPAKVLMLAGGTVALVSVARARCSGFRRARRPAPVTSGAGRLRLVPLLRLVMPAWTWNTSQLGDIFWGLGSLVAGAFGWVFDLVEKAVTNGIHFVLEMVGAVFDVVKVVTDNLIGNLGVITSTVEGLAQGAWEVGKQLTVLVPDAFRQALEQLQQIVWKAVEDWIPEILRRVSGLGADLIKTALGDLWDALQWLGDNIGDVIGFFEAMASGGLAFLINFVSDPLGTIWGLIEPLVSQLIDQAVALVGFGWDAFWGLFWPLLARQLGLPEDPADMINAAKFLFEVALMVVKGDVGGALRALVSGGTAYVEDQVPLLVRRYSTLLIELLSELLGMSDPPGYVSSTVKAV